MNGTRELPLDFRCLWRALGAEDKAASVAAWQLSSVWFKSSKSVTFFISSPLAKLLDVSSAVLSGKASLRTSFGPSPVLDMVRTGVGHWISTRCSTRKMLNDPWLVWFVSRSCLAASAGYKAWTGQLCQILMALIQLHRHWLHSSLKPQGPWKGELKAIGSRLAFTAVFWLCSLTQVLPMGIGLLRVLHQLLDSNKCFKMV